MRAVAASRRAAVPPDDDLIYLPLQPCDWPAAHGPLGHAILPPTSCPASAPGILPGCAQDGSLEPRAAVTYDYGPASMQAEIYTSSPTTGGADHAAGETVCDRPGTPAGKDAEESAGNPTEPAGHESDAPTFALPVHRLPGQTARPTLDYSIVEQIDGALHCLFGIRLERDVCAASAQEAVCASRGLPRFACLSEDIGFYHTRPSLVPHVRAVAASHKAGGVAIVPARCPADVEKTCFAYTHRVRKKRARAECSWRVYLKKATIFVFEIPQDALSPAPSGGALAVFFNFGRNVPMRRKRPELIQRGRLALQIQPSRAGAPRLGAVPRFLHRVSPMVEELCPSRADDVAPASAPYPAPSTASEAAVSSAAPIACPWKMCACSRRSQPTSRTGTWPRWPLRSCAGH